MNEFERVRAYLTDLQDRICAAIEAVDGRKGIDALAQLCREKLDADPFSGCVFIFRTRRGTACHTGCGCGSWCSSR